MKFKYYITLMAVLFLFACSDDQGKTAVRPPKAFQPGDECHVCGMIINRFPGPKGQAYNKRSEYVKKFCSTLDLMFWILQPENKPNITDIYVHDMALSSWNKPDDAHLISARNAYFVIGSEMQGAMGKTLASFSSKTIAEDFAARHNGKVYAFEEISLKLLSEQWTN